MKTLVALILTNMAWLAGYAWSGGVGIDPPFHTIVSMIGASESPSHKPTVIQTDERGYVICSKETAP